MGLIVRNQGKKSGGRFSSLDLTGNDIPKAIIIHEALGIFMLAMTWSAFYYLQISKIPMVQQRLNQLSSMISSKFPSQMNNINIPFFDKEVLTSRIGSSYIESSCFRKLIRPVTLPGKIFVTYKLVKAMSRWEKTKDKSELCVTNPLKDTSELIKKTCNYKKQRSFPAFNNPLFFEPSIL